MNQLQYYLIKGLVSGDVQLKRSYRIVNTYYPYLEYTFSLYRFKKKIGEAICGEQKSPFINVYGTFLNLKPLIKALDRIEKVAENKANKEFMKDLMDSLTKTETYRNE